MKCLGIVGVVMVFGAIGFMIFAASQHAAMDQCLKTYSYETCFQTLNR